MQAVVQIMYQQSRELFLYYIYSPQIRIPTLLSTMSMIVWLYCVKVFQYMKQIREYRRLPRLTNLNEIEIKGFKQIDNNLYESEWMLISGWLHCLLDQSMLIFTPKRTYNHRTRRVEVDLSKNERLVHSIRRQQTSIQIPQIGSSILSCILCQLEYNSSTESISIKNIKYLIPPSSLWSHLYQKLKVSTFIIIVQTVLSIGLLYRLYNKYQQIIDQQNNHDQIIHQDDDQLYQNMEIEMDIEQGLYCLDCQTKGRRVVVMPCSHLVYCTNCWNQQTNCPTCNNTIQSYSILYLND